MNDLFIQQLREFELTYVSPYLPAQASILEIGAGAGWQAHWLAERGYQVRAVDVPSSDYADRRIFPIEEYDGSHLPFPEADFDVVYTSHVLEYIVDIEALLAETRRVLVPKGLAVHVLPSWTCRFWTLAAHYPYWLKSFAALLFPGLVERDVSTDRVAERLPTYSTGQFLKKALRTVLVPSPHGVRGNALSELYYLSRFYWTGLFRRTGWTVVACRPCKVFNTQYGILGGLLGIPARHRLSYVLGGSSIVVVVRKQ